MTEPDQPLSRRARREAEAAAGRRSRGSDPVDGMPSAPTPPPAADPLGFIAAPPTAGQPTELLGAAPTAVAGAVPAAPTEVLGAALPDAAAAESAAATGDAPAPRGIGAFVRAHPRAVLSTALGVGFMLLATGALFAGVAVGSAQGAPAPVPTASATPTPDPRSLPATIAAPSRLRTCSIDAIARDERLTTFFGSVVNTTTGEVLFERQGQTPARTASALKVLTAAAALAVLGPDFRMTTRVVAGSTPDTVVLVGGGDATLSRLPAGQESIYRGAPKLSDLAAQVVAAHAAANPDSPGITSLVIDATYWSSADAWHPTWNRDRIAAGFQAPATALMVDGDRSDPRQQTSPRSNDPIGRAAAAFAQALADAGNPAGVPAISTGAAVGGTVLGQVQSQPVKTLIAQMLPNSDNMLGEMLARVTSKQLGLDGSTASLTQAITGALNTYGVPTDGLIIKDGSGLATDNAVPTRYFAQLFAVINARGNNLGIIMDALPVAGVSGTLSGRFTGSNAIARGNVTAKTGFLRTAHTLVGVVRAADGSVLSFGFYAIREGISDSARAALDTVTTAVFSCGDNLSNN